MGGETHGHAGEAQHAAPPLPAAGPEVVQGPLPDGAIVEPRRHHRLGVDVDAARQQPVELAEDVALAGIAHHPDAGLWFRCVDRHVDGAQTLAHDAVQLRLVAAGKGREVAVEEGQADVLVLQVERFPEALGHLVHETEHAVLLADLHFVLGQVHPDALAAVLHEGLEGAAVRPLQEEFGLVLPGDEELVVQLVQHCLAMDLQQGVARADAGLLGQTAGVHGDDLYALLCQAPLHAPDFLAGIRR